MKINTKFSSKKILLITVIFVFSIFIVLGIDRTDNITNLITNVETKAYVDAATGSGKVIHWDNCTSDYACQQAVGTTKIGCPRNATYVLVEHSCGSGYSGGSYGCWLHDLNNLTVKSVYDNAERASCGSIKCCVYS